MSCRIHSEEHRSTLLQQQQHWRQPYRGMQKANRAVVKARHTEVGRHRHAHTHTHAHTYTHTHTHTHTNTHTKHASITMTFVIIMLKTSCSPQCERPSARTWCKFLRRARDTAHSVLRSADALPPSCADVACKHAHGKRRVPLEYAHGWQKFMCSRTFPLQMRHALASGFILPGHE